MRGDDDNTVGSILRLRREEKNLAIKDISLETHINTSIIENLENNKFDTFPGEVYVVGFLRNYADFLGIESDLIVERYKRDQLLQLDTPFEYLTKINLPFFRKKKWLIIIFLVISILIAMIILFSNLN